MGLALLIFALFLQALPFEADEEFLIRNFTVEDGLPVNSINGIVQDDDGFIYFSTFDGLVRYDGYEFKVYNSGNTDGMFSNRIAGLLKTDSNEIWLILTDGSITRKTGFNFITYSSDQGDFEGLAKRFYQNKKGEIWISTTRGVYRFDSEAGSFHALQEKLLQSNTWVIEPSGKGGLFAVNENGLAEWEDGHATLLLERSNFPITIETILIIRQFNQHEIWIMGGGGLFRYSLSSGNIDFIYRTSDAESTVWNLHAERDGTYIVNSSEGFYSLHPENLQIRKLQPQISTITDRINLVFRGANNERILLGDDEVLIDGQIVFETEEIQSGLIDREGSLWISTEREGVFQISKSDVINISTDQISDFENIYPVIQTNDRALWAGSFGQGIFRISKDEITNWNSRNSNLTGDLCRFLFEDSDGTLYAGMWGQGLWTFKNNEWQTIQISEIGGSYQTVEAIFRDSRNRLFVGNHGPLLVQENGKFREFEDLERTEFYSVRVIRESSKGTLFIGTNGNGLTIIKDDSQANYTIRNSPIASDFIRDIYVQSPDTIWLATENLGLNRLVLNEQAELRDVVSITEKDGLIKNSLHRIIETSGGYLWISSNGGIMRISLDELNGYANGEIDDFFILVFDESNGMINREANGGVQTAGMLSADQKLWFPNQKGITIIDPANIANKNLLPPPQPIIEEIILPDSSLFVEELADISIPNLQRNARIKFSAPNFSSPDRIQFRYKLEGVNENWENVGPSLEAVFTNIPPGTHEFHVQTHRIGNTSEISEASIFITIPPAFYETRWFYLLMALFSGLVIFGGVKYRTRVLEYRERLLQKRVDQQTRELKVAAEQKSRFFSGITHELKTPLSLISSPLEDLLDHHNPVDISVETVRNRLQLMSRNSKRLQNLVDQILAVTKLNSDALRLTHKPVNIVDYTRQIIGQFQSKLDQQKIQLHFEADNLTGKIYLDTDAWERIVINLLSNAIRFSPRGSAIHIRITNLENRVSISVKDEGIGIDEQDAHKVFDYLYQAEGAYSAEGTGIGLYLVKGLVNHMKGEINLISKKGEGSEFIITLQKGFSHFPESDTIVHFQSGDFITKRTAASTDSEPPVNGTLNQSEATILVVEDNDDFRSYLQSILSEHYNIFTAEEGNSALKLLETKKADLIISDVMMPGMNGLEFINTLRKQEKYQHIPVVLLSAKDQEIDMETGLSTGADIYLTKPIKSSLLLSQIAAVLRRERVLKSNDISDSEKEENPLVRRVRTIIYRQLANQLLNVDMLADTLFVSRRKLYNDWKETGEITLNDFIKKVRLEEARILLSEQGFNVQETALAVGYSNTNYFSTSFKKEFGVSPSEV